jgi:tetratricopeptide (TPR) repeat protein
MKTLRPILYVSSGVCLVMGCWLAATLKPTFTPSPPRSSVSDARGAGGYSGSSSCRNCHRHFYDLWSGSRHGLAMQAYSDEFAKANLAPQGAPITIEDDGRKNYMAEIGGGQGRIRETNTGREAVFPITYVLGGKNVYFFLTPFERGRLQTLPLAFDVKRKAWYDAMSAADNGHVRDRTDTRKVHWTDRANTFNTSCYGCHVSQMSTRYDPGMDTYETRWTEPGINCEACHGPGGEHVAALRSAPKGAVPKDLKIVSPKSLSAEQVNSLCCSCHAKMSPVSAPLEPGGRFFDHYDLVTLESEDFYPDGRDLGENYTMTSWRMSSCVEAGGLDCLHCHTSSGRYRFAGRAATNEACLPCHEHEVEHLGSHSHHARTDHSPQCVDCHMPATSYAGMRRTDHSLRPPVPEGTLRYGSPNACNLCHTEKDAAWAQRQVVRWDKATRQRSYLRLAEWIDQARRRDWRNLDRMLAYLGTKGRDEVVAASLVRLLRGCPSSSKWSVVAKTLEHDPSPLVRAAAAEHLGGSLTESTIRALLKATKDDCRLVRVRAAASLASVDLRRLDIIVDGRPLIANPPRAVDSAMDELMAGLTVRADQPASHFNLANVLAAQGRTSEALDAYRTAIRLQPDFVPAYVNMAFAFNARGASADAEKCLTEALKREPNSALILTNLSLLFAGTGRLDRAESSFRRAWAIDATSAVVAYNLAVLLADTQPLEALTFAERAASLSPNDQRYAYAYAFQLTRLEQTNRAVTILRGLINRGPSTADSYMLLGQILERAHKNADAAAVCLKAADNPRLPEEQRRSFLESAARLRKR